MYMYLLSYVVCYIDHMNTAQPHMQLIFFPEIYRPSGAVINLVLPISSLQDLNIVGDNIVPLLA